MIFKKLIKILTAIVIALFIGLSIWSQVEYEDYRLNQIERYGILADRERISYMPVAFFYIGRFFGKYINDEQSSLILYKGLNLTSFLSKGFMDTYIVHCYYTQQEKEAFIKTNKFLKN